MLHKLLLSTVNKGKCVFLVIQVCHYSLGSLCSAKLPHTWSGFLSVLYLQHTLFSELHFSRPGHPLGFLANCMALQTAGIQGPHPLSYFPQALNGLLGTVEVIQKKGRKMKAQDFSTPRQSESLVLSDKMHPREALLQQTRCRGNDNNIKPGIMHLQAQSNVLNTEL